MLNRKLNLKTAWLRIPLTVMTGILLLAGCGSDENENEDQKDEKKPAYERVVILKQRFLQLENSLDEMERDLKIHKKRIQQTRETAKAIKRSLIKGNLKGYSIDTVTTDPVVLQTMADKRQDKKEARQAEQKKEESGDIVLNTLLIIVFVIFLVVIFIVALKDRKQASPYEPVSPSKYPTTGGTDESEATETTGDEETGSSFEYGELRPADRRETGPDTTPPSTDETEPGEEPGDKSPDNEEPRP